MSEHEPVQPAPPAQEPQARPRRRFLAGVLTGGLIGSLLTGGLGMYAQAQPGFGGWCGGGHGFGGYQRHGTHDADAAREKAAFATDWVLNRIQTSAEQRQQVRTIVQDAVQDLFQVREQHQAQHQAWVEALSQETIDRQALDRLRATEAQLADTAIQRVVNAVADAAEALTPAQRAALLDLTARWRH